MFDLFRYDGKRVVVVGAATGMGNAAARLLVDAGAEVVAMDFAPMDIAGMRHDHRQPRRQGIDRGRRRRVRRPRRRVVLLRGRRRRHTRHREDQLPRSPPHDQPDARRRDDRAGSAIGFISSAAGAGWARDDNMEILGEYLAIEDMDEASQWARDNGKADYFQSKMAVCLYVASNAYPLLKMGVRINAIMPGPTDTPLAQANKETWLGFGTDYRQETGVDASTPEDQAYPLVFLCSDAAKAITGITLTSDQGYFSSGITNSFPPAKGTADFLNGRY